METEKTKWFYVAGNDCTYCKDGLCGRLNELMEEGKSQRAASRIMEEECGGEYNANVIRHLFRYLTGRDSPTHRTAYTGQNEWYTPQIYIEAARECLGEIELDPATTESAQKRIKATEYYTAETNGLDKNWFGKMWMNPPYGRKLIGEFIRKCVEEYKAGRLKEAIILTHNFTDTKWFHHLEAVADKICFTEGRISFEEDDGFKASPTQGSSFFYLGENADKFTEIFGGFGFVR